MKNHGQRSHQRRPNKPSATSNTVPPKPPPPISVLPCELHLAISEYLVPHDQYALRLTSRYFNSILPRLDLRATVLLRDLEETGDSFFMRVDDLWACFSCKAIRSRPGYWSPSGLRRETREARICNRCEPDFVVFCANWAMSDSSGDERIVRDI